MTPDERERPGQGALDETSTDSIPDNPELVCEVWATRSAELGSLEAVWTEIADRFARQEATAQARAEVVRAAMRRLDYLIEHGHPAPILRPSRPVSPARLGKSWSKRAEGMRQKLRRAEPGNRNALLYWCVRTLSEDGAPDEAIESLAEPAQTAGLSEREIRQVLASVRRGRS